jgi:hypothetical protein
MFTGKAMKSFIRRKPPFGPCLLGVLTIGLLLAPGAASAPATGAVYAWGCGSGNHGQCVVPPRPRAA